MGGLSNGPIPDPHSLPNPPNRGAEKSQFEIAAKRLEMTNKLNRARLIRHFLALNLCLEQSCSFCQSPKMGEGRSTAINICSVVLRPDHNYGGNLVLTLLCQKLKTIKPLIVLDLRSLIWVSAKVVGAYDCPWAGITSRQAKVFSNVLSDIFVDLQPPGCHLKGLFDL